MIDYAAILTMNYPNSQWVLNNNDYETLQWLSDTPKPTQTELDEAWPQVDYANKCAIVENTRRTEYEEKSDGLFFQWQRGDGTEAAWRESVAQIKAANPYPAAP